MAGSSFETSNGLPGSIPSSLIFASIGASSFDGGLSGSSIATRAKNAAAFIAATWSRGDCFDSVATGAAPLAAGAPFWAGALSRGRRACTGPGS